MKEGSELEIGGQTVKLLLLTDSGSISVSKSLDINQVKRIAEINDTNGSKPSYFNINDDNKFTSKSSSVLGEGISISPATISLLSESPDIGAELKINIVSKTIMKLDIEGQPTEGGGTETKEFTLYRYSYGDVWYNGTKLISSIDKINHKNRRRFIEIGEKVYPGEYYCFACNEKIQVSSDKSTNFIYLSSTFKNPLYYNDGSSSKPKYYTEIGFDHLVTINFENI